jgi:hypothetical protein
LKEEMYPNWLRKGLIEDDLPWDKKADIDLKEFCAKYTLHDSFWVGIFHRVGFDETVVRAHSSLVGSLERIKVA